MTKLIRPDQAKPGDILVCQQNNQGQPVWFVLGGGKLWDLSRDKERARTFSDDNYGPYYAVVGNVFDCPEIWAKYDTGEANK